MRIEASSTAYSFVQGMMQLFRQTTFAVFLLCGLLARVEADIRPGDDFMNPPDAAKPWVNMWWFDTVKPEEITQHMEELKAKGIGGAMLIDLGNMPGAPYMSDKWRDLFRHAVREADRLGLKIGVNTCPGWPAGGPWITPEKSSWMTTSSKTILKGPQKFSGKLVKPPGIGDLFENVSVQAFPVADETLVEQPKVTVSSKPGDLPNLLDGNFNTVWKAGPEEKPLILIDFHKPHDVDWVWVDMTGKVDIEASDDGDGFRKITSLSDSGPNTIYQAVPSTHARWFRIELPKGASVRDFALGTKLEVYRVSRLAAKRGFTNPLGVTSNRQIDQVMLVRENLVGLPNDHPLNLQEKIDLTDKVSRDGLLEWDVPPGTWEVVRVGRTTTGIGVAFGKGLLTDYLSPAATDLNYEKGIKPLVGDAGETAGRTLKYFIEDNVEIDGMYSWTPALLSEFKKRRGYDPAPYLSAMAGEIVENVEITDRFLADVRRTVADCVADAHYGRWAELSHADGIQVRAEAGGQHHPRLLCNDGLMNQGRMDVPVAEFWEIELWKENQWAPADHHLITTPGWDEAAQNVNAKQAASAGHLYGKRIVAAEGFTSGGRLQHWSQTPSGLLRHANNAFCEGINALSIHGSATSGPKDGLPGKAVFGGIHFNHNITWWNQGAAEFLLYLSRCCHLLRQGNFVADVLYYNGDEVPNFVPPKHVDPSLGFGYDYDVCNSEVLLNRLSVKDGRIVLPDGMNYRVLVLPERPVIPLTVAAKLRDLVQAGATVLGPKPRRTPGLSGYPESEKQLKEIVSSVWGTNEDSDTSRHLFGAGRVVNGCSIQEFLESDGVRPDFAYKADARNPLLDFIHRHTEDTEIYFVANKRGEALTAKCCFRVNGKQPELWNPVTGRKQDLPQFQEHDGVTSVSLEFEPYGSMFVIFQKQTPKEKFVVRKGLKVNFPKISCLQTLEGPWKVQFDPKWFYPTNDLAGDAAIGIVVFDKLEDWSSRPEQAIKNFSGKADYKQTFKVSSFHHGLKYFLDLGTVKETAHVFLNGKDMGVVWCAPWKVDVTSALKRGENSLEIEVVNLWPNRLMGDKRLPVSERRTRTHLFVGWLNNDRFPSGLLGPVTLQTAASEEN